MPINILNRQGPICFESSTLNFSSGSSINSLLENFLTPGTQNFSLSASLSEIVKRKGNSIEETQIDNNGIGTSLTNFDNTKQIRFSSFLNASYLSASIKQKNNGVVSVDIYSPSVVPNNNFLTGNTTDQVFKYSLYTKVGITTPIVDSGWTKVHSYTKTGNNCFNFYDLIDSNSYKITVKDCLSNAFTSSMFVGNCTDTISTNNSFTYTISSISFESAIDLVKKDILDDLSGLNTYQLTDLLGAGPNKLGILDSLKSIITNPKLYKNQNTLNPILKYVDNAGYERTIVFDGIIYQDTNKNYIFNGSAHAYYNNVNPRDCYYSFENVNTSGKVTLYVLAKSTKISGTNCESEPTRIGYLPSTLFMKGPTCGKLDCGYGKPQIICNPTTTYQIRHSSSFFVVNENDHDLTINAISTDPVDWKDSNGENINEILTPIQILPTGTITIPPKSSRKISVGFGVNRYNDVDQPVSFFVKTPVNLSLPDGFGYEPKTKTSELVVSFDKNSCLISTSPLQLISQASNIGNVFYTGLTNESWLDIKTKISNLISKDYGIFSDKLYGNAIVSSLPSTGCVLPTTIIQQNINLNLTWTLVTFSPSQPYVCNDIQFSGTYNVTVTNSTYGTSNFYIYFLRKNDNSLGSYINLTQLGGSSNPS